MNSSQRIRDCSPFWQGGFVDSGRTADFRPRLAGLFVFLLQHHDGPAIGRHSGEGQDSTDGKPTGTGDQNGKEKPNQGEVVLKPAILKEESFLEMDLLDSADHDDD